MKPASRPSTWACDSACIINPPPPNSSATVRTTTVRGNRCICSNDSMGIGACAGMLLISDPLAAPLGNQAGRKNADQYDDRGKGDHVLVGARKRQHDHDQGLYAGKQETAENRTEQAAEAADHRRREA